MGTTLRLSTCDFDPENAILAYVSFVGIDRMTLKAIVYRWYDLANKVKMFTIEQFSADGKRSSDVKVFPAGVKLKVEPN